MKAQTQLRSCSPLVQGGVTKWAVANTPGNTYRGTLRPFSSKPTILSVASLGITWFIVGSGHFGVCSKSAERRS